MGFFGVVICAAFFVWAVASCLDRALNIYLIQYLKHFRGKKLLPLVLWFVAGLVFLALGAGLLGRPILGLLGLAFLPPLLRPVHGWVVGRRIATLDASSLSFFHALHGLIRAGLSLPSALFQLSHSLPTPFGMALQRFLQQYEKGTSLKECLFRFRETALRASAGPLALLEMAYRNGLPVAPLLEKMLPVMEAEQLSREKIISLTRASLVQGALAFALPWLLAATLGFFQPDLLAGFSGSPFLIPILLLSLVWEACGVYFIWRVSKFY